MHATAESISEHAGRFVRGRRGMLAAKVAKSRRVRSVTFTIDSWEMNTGDGNHMVQICDFNPRFEVYLERTYGSGDVARSFESSTKKIKMCQPSPTKGDGQVMFHNGVTMTGDTSGPYTLTGDVLLNDAGGPCDSNLDCAVGLYCDNSEREPVCKDLPGTSCILGRGNRDCDILGDPLLTKCYAAYSSISGGGFCSCDNEPSNNPCEDESHTCDFDCNIGDAVPQCKSPDERNQDCAGMTCNMDSVCPAGEPSPPSCTEP